MADAKIIREWLDRADDDLAYAVASLEDELPFYSQICFHFQQSAEKYLKAYIIAFDLEFKKIHNLLVLQKICAKREIAFQKLREDCEILNRYYIDTRYPVHWPIHHSKDSAKEARQAAEHIATFVKEKL